MNKVRWGILGTAFISEKAFLPAVRASSNSEVIGVASRDRKKAETWAQRNYIPRFYGSYDELLQDPDIEAVYIPLPNHRHASFSIKALNAGKHVFTEKPCVVSLYELDEIFRCADEKNRIFAEAFMLHHHDGLRKLGQWIRSGRWGQVRQVSSKLWLNLKEQKDNIRFADRPGAGALFDVGTYTLLLIRSLVGDEPAAVDGFALYKEGTEKTDVAFSVSMICHNGTMGSMQGGFIDSRPAPGIFCPAQIIMDHGEIEIPNFLDNSGSFRYILYEGGEGQVCQLKTRNYYVQEVDNFAAAVRGKGTLFIPREEIRLHIEALLNIAQLCYQNKRAGGPSYTF